MKVLISVPDQKASFLREVLSHFSYVKITTIAPEKADFLEDLSESVNQVNAYKKKKSKLKSAKTFIGSL